MLGTEWAILLLKGALRGLSHIVGSYCVIHKRALLLCGAPFRR